MIAKPRPPMPARPGVAPARPTQPPKQLLPSSGARVPSTAPVAHNHQGGPIAAAVPPAASAAMVAAVSANTASHGSLSSQIGELDSEIVALTRALVELTQVLVNGGSEPASADADPIVPVENTPADPLS